MSAARRTTHVATPTGADPHLYVSREFAAMMRRRVRANRLRYAVQWAAAALLILIVAAGGALALAALANILIASLGIISGQ